MTLEERVDRLERELDVLQSTESLRRLLSQYAVGIDDKKPELLRNAFAADARLAIPAWGIELSGQSALLGFFEGYWDRFQSPRRYTANERFDIHGNEATAFMYWHVTQAREGESVLAWGTYDWEFRRSDERWQIQSEVVHIHVMTTLARGWADAPEVMQLG
jgi:ketosteroid isomerase-like protein